MAVVHRNRQQVRCSPAPSPPTPSRARCCRRMACRRRMPRPSRSCLVSADLRGVDTHGLCRLPIYLERVRKGLINPKPEPGAQARHAGRRHARRPERLRLRHRHARHARSDRDGARVRHRRGVGAALDAFRHGRVLRAARGRGRPDGDGVLQRLAGDAAWGAKQMLLGTNPFCMAAPAGKHRPIILDMSPAVAARGKIRKAERRGEKIPLGYALDAQGRPTTDPKAALAGGVVLPIGEHKGSGLSMFMDIFGGVISGANFGGDVGDQYKAFDRGAGRRPLLPGDEAQSVRHRGRLPRPHRHADRAHEVRAAGRRLLPRCWCRASPRTAMRRSAASPAFPMRRARSRRCRTRPSAPASSRWWWRTGRSALKKTSTGNA